MNLEESITHLRKIGFVVSKMPNGNHSIARIGYKEGRPAGSSRWGYIIPEDTGYDARGVIAYAKMHSSSNNQNSALRQSVKHITGRQRARVREIIASRDEETMDEKLSTHYQKDDDQWNYD